MKKLLVISSFLISVLSLAIAQEVNNNNQIAQEDYTRYLDKRMEMDLRLNAMKAINLTPEEIEAFNPIFDNYIAAKDMVTDKKMRAFENFVNDMEKEFLPRKLDEETSDFIESYWEAEIAEMKLKKQTYDILENKIDYRKAIEFFLFEESAENMLSYGMLRTKMPTIVYFEKSRVLPETNNKPAGVSDKAWKLYIDRKLNMDFRLAAIKEMKLTADEIAEFNPLFDKYIDKKDKITEKKFQLTDEYIMDLAEEEDKEDRTETTSDYIEEFWEEEIAEMELKEKFYDVLENKIPYTKAIRFFLLEDALESRVRYNDLKVNMPNLMILENVSKSTNTQRKSNVMTKEREAAHHNSTGSVHTTNSGMNQTDAAIDMSNHVPAMNSSEKKSTINDSDVDHQMSKEKKMVDLHKNKTTIPSAVQTNINRDNTKTTPVIHAEDITYEIGQEKGTTILDEKIEKTKIASPILNNNREATNIDESSQTTTIKETTYEMSQEKGTAILDEKTETTKVVSPTINGKKVAMDIDESSQTTIEKETTYEMSQEKGATILDKRTTNDDQLTSNSTTVLTTTDGTDKNVVSTTTKIIKQPYSQELFALDNWVGEHRGQMSLDHDYTSNGLKATVAAIESVAKNTPLAIDNWASHKSSILNAAREITIDKYATNHADLISVAFKKISKCTEMLNRENPTMETINKVSVLNGIAFKITPEILLLKQDNVVYDFFSQANNILKDIWNENAKQSVKGTIANTLGNLK